MRRKRSAPSAYLSAPSPDYGQVLHPSPSLPPRVRNVALACTAVAMLGVGGLLAGVAWYAQQPNEEPLTLVRLGSSEIGALAAADAATPDAAQQANAAAATDTAARPAAKPPVAATAVPADAQTEAKAQALIAPNDPRWARDVGPATGTPSLGRADAANLLAYADRTESPAWQALVDTVARESKGDAELGTEEADEATVADDDDDGGTLRTAAIDPKPERKAAVEPAAKPARVETSGAAPTGTARITRGANMRAAGRKGARIIGTVPGGTTVKLVSCDIWCEVVHKGSRGFVYKDFVTRQAAAKPAAEAKPEETDKPAIVPAETLPQAQAGR